MYKKVITLVMLLLLYSTQIYGENFKLSSEKRADIIKLINMTGTINIASQFANMQSRQMFDLIKKSNPEIPARAVEIIEAELTNLIDEEMRKETFYDYFVPIYDKYYSHKEIKGLINFYKTALGKKTIRVMPYITQECMMAGQKWVDSIVPIAIERITERFKAEGIDLKN